MSPCCSSSVRSPKSQLAKPAGQKSQHLWLYSVVSLDWHSGAEGKLTLLCARCKLLVELEAAGWAGDETVVEKESACATLTSL